MAGKKYLTFYYKQVKFKNGLILQKILSSLKHLNTTQRTQVIGSRSYILNHICESDGMYYAEIVCYEKDRRQGIIHTTPSNDNLYERNISTKDIKDDDTVEKEFVHSRIIFGLIGNDLAICTSQMQLQTFVTYLNFLLQTYYWQATDQVQAIVITDVVSHTLKQKLKTTHVKCVKIGQDVNTEQHLDNKHYFIKNSLIQKLVQTFGVQDGYSQDLDDANLRLSVVMDYTNKTTAQGQKILDDITTALATIDEQMIRIDFADGTDFKGGQIRIKSRLGQKLLNDNGFDRMQLQNDIRLFLEQNLE